MAVIRPSSDLRNKYNEISEFCHTHNEPVFITKNGTGDLVVLSNAEYERLCAVNDLHRKLDEGITAMERGRVRPAEVVFAEVEQRFGLSGGEA